MPTAQLPTVGRRVYYRPTVADTKIFHNLDDNPDTPRMQQQPMDAGVLYVHPDGQHVNLLVTDHIGRQRFREHVLLVQPGNPEPPEEFCHWMDYQIKQFEQRPAPPPVESQQRQEGQTAGAEGGAS